MKILLTGANGFIGSYFCQRYAHKYRLSTFSFLQDDFALLDLKGVAVVVHLSALVHQMGGASEDAYEKVNVTQTLSLAKKAKESGVGQFIFMSTVKVYGEESDLIYSETSECHPQDGYGKSKLKAELELQKLQCESFKVVILRTPIVYGHGVKANIKNLIHLVQKVPLLPFANIENRRSMVYVGNLCYLMDVAIQKVACGIFLSCDDTPLSTTELIKLLAKELDTKVILLEIPFFATLLKFLKPDFHKRLYGSLEVDNRATRKALFGDENCPSLYSSEEGIQEMLNPKL